MILPDHKHHSKIRLQAKLAESKFIAAGKHATVFATYGLDQTSLATQEPEMYLNMWGVVEVCHDNKKAPPL